MGENTITCKTHERYGLETDGYTLIEILIAISIFAIGMLAIASMQIGATQGTSTARSNTELTAYATDQIERLTRLKYNDADLAEGQYSVNDPNMDRFSATWVIVDDEVFAGTKTVTLTATEALRGRTRDLTFQIVIPEIIE